jgi:hypothetical protein
MMNFICECDRRDERGGKRSDDDSFHDELPSRWVGQWS